MPKIPKKGQKPLLYKPYSPDQIKALGQDYNALNSTMPDGWNKEGLAQVQSLGYSVAGVHNLRPSSKAWTPAQLLEHTNQLTPYVLDPRLMGREELYVLGSIEAEGFVPNAKMYADRGKNLKLKTKKEMPTVKSSRVESSKRRARESSESSGTDGQSSGQNLKPTEAEGGNLSYVHPNHSLLEHSNDREHIRAILDKRLKSQGGSVTGTIIVNNTDIPRIYSAT